MAIDASTAIIAMTTKSSIKVKPPCGGKVKRRHSYKSYSASTVHLMDWFAVKHFATKPDAVLRFAVTVTLAYPSALHVTEVFEGVRVTVPPAVVIVVFAQFLRFEVVTFPPGFSIQYAAISIIQALAIGSA